MTDSQQRRFRLWPWRRHSAATAITPPAASELATKLIELMHLERGVAALYYYLPDESLSALAQDLCAARRGANLIDQGLDRELHRKEPPLEAWTAVSALWYSAVWQPGEILATFGFRLIEALRADNELWSVIIDPRAQFFGMAVTTDEAHCYRCVLVVGQKGHEVDSSASTAAR